jgi:hypothetical protein
VQDADGGCGELGDLYALAGERVVSDVKKQIGRKRVESRREEGRGEGTGRKRVKKIVSDRG